MASCCPTLRLASRDRYNNRVIPADGRCAGGDPSPVAAAGGLARSPGPEPSVGSSPEPQASRGRPSSLFCRRVTSNRARGAIAHYKATQAAAAAPRCALELLVQDCPKVLWWEDKSSVSLSDYRCSRHSSPQALLSLHPSLTLSNMTHRARRQSPLQVRAFIHILNLHRWANNRSQGRCDRPARSRDGQAARVHQASICLI